MRSVSAPPEPLFVASMELEEPNIACHGTDLFCIAGDLGLRMESRSGESGCGAYCGIPCMIGCS
jgi:hypothetical protein